MRVTGPNTKIRLQQCSRSLLCSRENVYEFYCAFDNPVFKKVRITTIDVLWTFFCPLCMGVQSSSWTCHITNSFLEHPRGFYVTKLEIVPCCNASFNHLFTKMRTLTGTQSARSHAEMHFNSFRRRRAVLSNLTA